jgi:hypothetical protein
MKTKIMALAIILTAIVTVQASAGVLVDRNVWGNAVGHTHMTPYGFSTHLGGSSASDYAAYAYPNAWNWGYGYGCGCGC